MVFCIFFISATRLTIINLSVNKQLGNVAMVMTQACHKASLRLTRLMKHFSTESPITCKPSSNLSESINNIPAFSYIETINQTCNDKFIVKNLKESRISLVLVHNSVTLQLKLQRKPELKIVNVKRKLPFNLVTSGNK